MIEEQGRVAAVDGDSVWVETVKSSTCTSCSARLGCGQHLSEKYRSNNSSAYIRVSSQWPLSEGDRVIVGIPESSLLRASALMYLLPLVMMMAGLWLISLLGGNDVMLLLAVAAGINSRVSACPQAGAAKKWSLSCEGGSGYFQERNRS